MLDKKTGHTCISNSTILPVNLPPQVTETTISIDLSPGNAQAFPFTAGLIDKFDKVRWKGVSMRWIPNVPTSVGGGVAFYFDMDRKDVGAVTLEDALQNKGCVQGPVWSPDIHFNIPREMLRSGEWFTTTSSADTTAADNTFGSPGRIHLIVTPFSGVVGTTPVRLGSLQIDYALDFAAVSNQSTPEVPPTFKDRTTLNYRDTGLVVYNRVHLLMWMFFRAGCSKKPSFFEYLSILDHAGSVIPELSAQFMPDSHSLDKDALREAVLTSSLRSLSLVPTPRGLVDDSTYPAVPDLGTLVYNFGAPPLPPGSSGFNVPLKWLQGNGTDPTQYITPFTHGMIFGNQKALIKNNPKTSLGGPSGFVLSSVGIKGIPQLQPQVLRGPVSSLDYVEQAVDDADFRASNKFCENYSADLFGNEAFKTSFYLPGYLKYDGGNSFAGAVTNTALWRIGRAPEDVTPEDTPANAKNVRVDYYMFPSGVDATLRAGQRCVWIVLSSQSASGNRSIYFTSTAEYLTFPDLSQNATEIANEAFATFHPKFNTEFQKYGENVSATIVARSVRLWILGNIL